MKKFANILMLLLCVCIVSCDDDSDTAALGIGVTGRDVDITASGGTLTVTLSMEGDQVVSDQSWCAASISGKLVTLTVEANKGLEGRTALVTVTKGAENISFPITQPGNKIPLAETEKVAFDAHGGTREISVESTLALEAFVPADAPWLTAQVNGDKLILTAQNNYTLNNLSTNVKLKSGNLETEIVVTQSGIALVPEKTDVVMYNGGDEKTIEVESTLDFTAVSGAQWLTVTKNDGSITLNAEDNSGNALRTAAVTLTSESLVVTINVTQRPPIYSDYIGKWALTGMNGNTSFTYNLSIEQATANSTYTLSGWGKSSLATDNALRASFDAASGVIYITTHKNIGIYTDADGDYDVCFYGLIEKAPGSLSFVTGNYICYIGMLQRDGTVQWENGSVELSNGIEYRLVGSIYCMISQVSGGIYNFNADIPYMDNPVMKKTDATRSVRSSLIPIKNGGKITCFEYVKASEL